MRFAALALLAACSREPDLAFDSVSVDYNGFPRIDAEIRTAMAVIKERAFAACPKNRAGILRQNFCASIDFRGYPFSCMGRDGYAGCQPFPTHCAFDIGYRVPLDESALIDEVGHYVWDLCFDRSGEATGADRSVYEPDFAVWVDDTRAELKRRLAQ